MANRIRIKSESQIHFVTFSVYKHIPVFKNNMIAGEFFSNLRFYEGKGRYKLLGYVIMPHHVHLIVEIMENSNISSLIRDIKKYFSYRVKNFLLGKSTFDINQFDNNGRFQFWERGFDEVTIVSEKMFWVKLKYIHNNPIKVGLVERAEDYMLSSAKDYLED